MKVTSRMGTEDDNQNSILKGILQNGSSFNYPGVCNIKVKIYFHFYKSMSLTTFKILWTLSLTAAVMIFLWCSFSAVRFGRVPKREKAKITAAMESSRLKNMENRVMTEMADDAKIIETVVRAHFDTCDYTAEKIKPFIAKAQSEKQFTQCTGMVSTHISNY